MMHWYKRTTLPATPQRQFNALPLDQVIHSLSLQSDQGDLKTPHHPREEKIIYNVLFLKKITLQGTNSIGHFDCCLPWKYLSHYILMMQFNLMYLWACYGSPWLSWHTLLAWYSTFTLHGKSWQVTQHPTYALYK